jgi:hypothetical protein
MSAFDALIEGISVGEYITENPDGTKTLRLDSPFTMQLRDGNGLTDVSVDGLRLRPPKLREIDQLEAGPTTKFLPIARAFAAKLIVDPLPCPQKYIDDLEGGDGFRLLAVALGFLPKVAAPKDGGQTLAA